MKRQAKVVLVLASLMVQTAFADGPAGAGAALSSLLGMVSIFILSLGAAAGVMALSALMLSAEATRSHIEALSEIADRAPRKSLAIGLGAGAAGFLVSILMMQAPPLKLIGIALFGFLVVGTLKGFVSRVMAAGKSVGSHCAGFFQVPFRDVVLGTMLFEMVFLFPVVGQLFVLLAAAQGFGAYVLHAAGSGSQPLALKGVEIAPAPAA